MTVKELMHQLEGEDPEAEVLTAYPSGDYWGRTIGNEPRYVEEIECKWSEYHRSWQVPDPDKDREEDEKHKTFIVLHGS